MNTTADHNPYEPPKADVVLPPQPGPEAHFVDGGKSVDAGNGISWISAGWSLFAKSPGVWIGLILVFFILWIFVSVLPLVGGIAAQMLSPIVLGGIMLGCRSLDQGGELRVDHLFAAFKEKAGPLAIVGLLVLIFTLLIVTALVIIALVMFGGAIFSAISNDDPSSLQTMMEDRGWLMLAILVLLAFGLFVPVSMAAWFAPPLVVFHNLDSWAAMKQSFRGCLRNILPFLLYGIVFFIISMLAMVPLFLGLLIVVPMVYGSQYAAYKDIYLEESSLVKS